MKPEKFLSCIFAGVIVLFMLSISGGILADKSTDSGIREIISFCAENQIPMRYKLIEAAKKYEDIISQVHAYNSIMELHDGYFSSFAISRDVSGDSESVIKFAELCRDNGINFLYINLPSKICVSQDKDVSGLLDFSNQNADRFLSLLQESGVKYYDFRKNLHEQGMNHHESFFITDHHWKPETGLWAAREILTILRDSYEWPVNPEILRPENFTRVIYHDYFLGSHGKKVTLSRANPENISLIYPKFETCIKYEIPELCINTSGDFAIIYDMTEIQSRDYYNRNPYAAYDYADQPLIKFTNLSAVCNKKILVIHDSFANCVVPFTALEIKNVIEIDLRCFNESLTDFIKLESPDLIIVMYNSNVPGASGKIYDFN